MNSAANPTVAHVARTGCGATDECVAVSDETACGVAISDVVAGDDAAGGNAAVGSDAGWGAGTNHVSPELRRDCGGGNKDATPPPPRLPAAYEGMPASRHRRCCISNTSGRALTLGRRSGRLEVGTLSTLLPYYPGLARDNEVSTTLPAHVSTRVNKEHQSLHAFRMCSMLLNSRLS